ncbi:MAG TPA: hypothetical protein PKI51_06175 [Anaerolineaceae bacterium]|nr:hypothetical protein [Anaerolineaceae bacterium]
MSNLWFDVMSRFEDNPDWSRINFDGEKAAKMYERRLGIGQKSKNQVEDYSWLKPPENWKSEEH